MFWLRNKKNNFQLNSYRGGMGGGGGVGAGPQQTFLGIESRDIILKLNCNSFSGDCFV